MTSEQSATAHVPTRRERLRSELTEQIIEIGRRQLEQGGVAGVNWRAIAEEIGMNPASLYTYVDGINDLYTRILGQSCRSLTDAIDGAARAHAHADPLTRLLECARAYRRWAVDRPNEFNLIFTNQIPGSDDAAADPNSDPLKAVNRPFDAAMLELLARPRDQVATVDDLSPKRRSLVAAARSMMHGFTILEINQHAPYPEGSEDGMLRALSRLIRRSGHAG
ncbi:MAG: WHG domain-containing protein [Ilumatobacter sp.]